MTQIQYTNTEKVLLKRKAPWKHLVSTWKYLIRYLRKNEITYAEYLQSKHWQQLRYNKGLTEQRKCYLCKRSSNKVPLQLHHKTYRRIGHEELKDLVWLCNRCHKLVHKYGHQRANQKRHRNKRKEELRNLQPNTKQKCFRRAEAA